MDGFIETRVPSSVLTNPKVDVATISNRRIDWNMLDDLDREDGDDRIVAQALNAIVDDPGRLVLLSHDMRPRDAAQSHGLAARKLPESWLREPEPSPDHRRINDLQDKVRLLSLDQPELAVRLEVVTPQPWRYLEVAAPTGEEVSWVLGRLLAQATTQSRGGPFNIRSFDFDQTHDDRVDRWEDDMRREVPLMHQGMARQFAQHGIRVTVENIGSISAEGLSVEIRTGNALLHSMPYRIEIFGTEPPEPKMLYEQIGNFSHRDLVSGHREPFTFYWDEGGPGSHVILSCSSFRQGKSHVVDLTVELLPGSPPKAQIEAVVTASNMKGETRGRLLVDADYVPVQFDEVFDIQKAEFIERTAFVMPADWDPDDINLYLNSGIAYER